MKLKPTPPPQPPNLPEVALREWDLSGEPLRDEATFEALSLRGAAFGSAANSRWTGCRFERARLTGADWTATHWEDCRFADCDLANAAGPKLYAIRIAFQDCRFLGFQAVESNWRDATFHRCPTSLSNLSGARFERARFQECDLTDADFTDCDLRGVIFRDCRLTGADFTGAKLDGADWRGCEIQNVRIGIRDMRGLKVTEPQGAYFARLLGLKVLAPPEDEA